MSTYKLLTEDQKAQAKFIFKRVIVPQLGDGAILDIRDHCNAVLVRCHSGTLSDRTFEQHLAIAKKQNNDLQAYPYVKSTWELRDQVCAPKAGGIRTPHNDRFSISGFTWQQNQNAALWLANALDRISYPEACKIAGDSGEIRSFQELSSKLSAAYSRLPSSIVI